MRLVRPSFAAAVAAAASLAGCAPPNSAPPARVSATTALAFAPVERTAPDGRVVEIMALAPVRARGVILFSHGGGSRPEAYLELARAMAGQGFAVLAPRHADSLSLPADKRSSMQAALATRIGDMKLAAAHAAQAFPGLPLAEVGHSYGSLTALIGAGALSYIIPGAVPGVKATVMFSSPGPIAPLTTSPKAFAAVTGPTLLVTGSADTVSGFVTDPAQHLHYFDGLPAGDHTALVVKGGTHDFVRGGQAASATVSAFVADFLASRVLGDARAGKRFDAATSDALVEIRRR